MSVLDLHRADLGHAAVLDRQARGLDIEYHRFPVHVAGALAVEGGGGVVDEVGLHAPDDLLADLLGGEHGVLVGLDVAVVGDGDGLMPPLVGLLDQVRGGDDGVHGGHLGMDVELHPLLLGLVLAGGAADLGDGVVVEKEVGALGRVSAHFPLGVASHGHYRAVGHHLTDGVGVLGEHADTADLQRSGIIGDVKGNIEFIALSCRLLGKAEDLAQHHDVAHGLVDGGQGGGDNVKLTAHGELGLGYIEVHEADLHATVFDDGGLHRAASLAVEGLDPGEDLGLLGGLGILLILLGGLALGQSHGVPAVRLHDLLVHGGQTLGLALVHHGLGKVVGDLNADTDIQSELAVEDAPHDVGGMGTADELDPRLGEGDADDEGVFLQLVAVLTEKTPRHNTDTLGLLQELGDVVGGE